MSDVVTFQLPKTATTVCSEYFTRNLSPVKGKPTNGYGQWLMHSPTMVKQTVDIPPNTYEIKVFLNTEPTYGDPEEGLGGYIGGCVDPLPSKLCKPLPSWQSAVNACSETPVCNGITKTVPSVQPPTYSLRSGKYNDTGTGEQSWLKPEGNAGKTATEPGTWLHFIKNGLVKMLRFTDSVGRVWTTDLTDPIIWSTTQAGTTTPLNGNGAMYYTQATFKLESNSSSTRPSAKFSASDIGMYSSPSLTGHLYFSGKVPATMPSTSSPDSIDPMVRTVGLSNTGLLFSVNITPLNNTAAEYTMYMQTGMFGAASANTVGRFDIPNSTTSAVNHFIVTGVKATGCKSENDIQLKTSYRTLNGATLAYIQDRTLRINLNDLSLPTQSESYIDISGKGDCVLTFSPTSQVQGYSGEGEGGKRPVATSSKTNYNVYDSSAPFCTFEEGYPLWKAPETDSSLQTNTYSNKCGSSGDTPCVSGQFVHPSISTAAVAMPSFATAKSTQSFGGTANPPVKSMQRFQGGCLPNLGGDGGSPAYIGAKCPAGEVPCIPSTFPTTSHSSPKSGQCCFKSDGSYKCTSPFTCYDPLKQLCEHGQVQNGQFVLPVSTLQGQTSGDGSNDQSVVTTSFAFGNDAAIKAYCGGEETCPLFVKDGDTTKPFGPLLSCGNIQDPETCARVASEKIASRSGIDEYSAKCPQNTSSTILGQGNITLLPDAQNGNVLGYSDQGICYRNSMCTSKSDCPGNSQCEGGICTCSKPGDCSGSGSQTNYECVGGQCMTGCNPSTGPQYLERYRGACRRIPPMNTLYDLPYLTTYPTPGIDKFAKHGWEPSNFVYKDYLYEYVGSKRECSSTDFYTYNAIRFKDTDTSLVKNGDYYIQRIATKPYSRCTFPPVFDYHNESLFLKQTKCENVNGCSDRATDIGIILDGRIEKIVDLSAWAESSPNQSS